MSCGSLEPPPVKMVALMVHEADTLRLVSQVHNPAVEPVVMDVVPQLVVGGPYWRQTLSQSSSAGGAGGLRGCVPDEASPSSWKTPVSWTANAGAENTTISSAAEKTTPSQETAFRLLPVATWPSSRAFSSPNRKCN